MHPKDSVIIRLYCNEFVLLQLLEDDRDRKKSRPKATTNLQITAVSVFQVLYEVK